MTFADIFTLLMPMTLMYAMQTLSSHIIDDESAWCNIIFDVDYLSRTSRWLRFSTV